MRSLISLLRTIGVSWDANLSENSSNLLVPQKTIKSYITSRLGTVAYAGGTTGATLTIDSANGGIQAFTLGANTVITLPDAPASTTGYDIELLLTQDATGGRLPIFVNASGDVLKWIYQKSPNLNNFNLQGEALNWIRIIGQANTINAEFKNPKDDDDIVSGGSVIDRLLWSFIGQTVVSKRGPFNIIANEVATTDATLTTLESIPVELNCTVLAFTFIIASRDTGAESGFWTVLTGFRRGSSGNVAKIGTEIVSGQEDSAGAPVPSCAVDTTNQLGLIQVTGVLANNINWTSYTLYFKVNQ